MTLKKDYTDLEEELDLEEFKNSVNDYFSSIKDPRECNKTTYPLSHVFFIILSATLAGANCIYQIVLFAKAKKKWIENLTGVKSIPSYGVFWWILVRLKPNYLKELLKGWLETLPDGLKNQVLAIDGKHLKGTKNQATSNPAIHLVSLFSVDKGLVLTEQAVENKSNEIQAIPKILEEIIIEGAIITIDAMGCQKKIASQIVERGAHYVLALKKNAGLIYDEIIQYFKEAKEAGYEYLDHSFYKENDTSHGRTVVREIRYVQDIEWLPQAQEWKGLKGFIQIVCQRTEKGKTTLEHRYYITSMEAQSERLGRIIRSHWKIENNQHRQLDVNFMEDDNAANTGYAAENLALFRRIALNILRPGKGLSDRRKNAAWNEEYLTQLVSNFFIKYL